MFILFACKPDQQGSKSTLPGVSGKPGEIVVVMDTAKFNRAPGLAIKKELQKAKKGYKGYEEIRRLRRDRRKSQEQRKNPKQAPRLKLQEEEVGEIRGP